VFNLSLIHLLRDKHYVGRQESGGGVGATGNQGGSVARALAKTGRYQVRGVTRDLTSQRAQELRVQGVDLMNFDLNDRQGLQIVMSGADICFVNTATDFEDPNCLDNEIAQGCFIADFCKQEKVGHVVLSSQLNSNKICSIMARHLVAKAEVEQYMRELALPLTCLIMPVYFEDLVGLFRPQTRDGRTYDVEIPMGQTPLDMMSVDDVGGVVKHVFENREKYLDKTVSVCGDKVTVREIAQILTKYLQPKTFTHRQLSVYEFHQQSRLPGAADWANMFQFFMRVDQRYNLAETKRMNPDVATFDQWVAENAQALKHII